MIRVLAEVDATRRIIAEHAPTRDRDGETVCSTCVFVGDDEDQGGNRFRYREHHAWPCDTVSLLALPYAGHADYREEWRPA